MKAYLIDPLARTVEEIELEGGLDPMYKALDCDTFDIARIGHRLTDDCIYVDDIGMIRHDAGERGTFKYRMDGNLLFGRGLVVGTDSEGNSIPPAKPVEHYRMNVWFPIYAGFEAGPATTQAEPWDVDDAPTSVSYKHGDSDVPPEYTA